MKLGVSARYQSDCYENIKFVNMPGKRGHFIKCVSFKQFS